MTEQTTRTPPDIDKTGDRYNDSPLVYGSSRAHITPNTLKMIRANAGRVPAVVIAQALCWSLRKLERVCAARDIDLKLPTPQPVNRARYWIEVATRRLITAVSR